MVRSNRWLPFSILALLLALAVSPAPDASAAADSIGVVNVNTATLDELQRLPGIGESRARAIMAARETRGGFATIDELVEVKGIGETLLERLRPHVAISGQTTALNQ